LDSPCRRSSPIVSPEWVTARSCTSWAARRSPPRTSLERHGSPGLSGKPEAGALAPAVVLVPLGAAPLRFEAVQRCHAENPGRRACPRSGVARSRTQSASAAPNGVRRVYDRVRMALRAKNYAAEATAL
jgi:hypothetical protein